MATRAKTKSADSGRLDAAAWTEAALEALASKGIDGVRVEILAKELGGTKGSFYWHFKDRDALLESVLAHWRRRATLALIERYDKGDAPPEVRLGRLLQLPLVGRRSALGADQELAIRLWGRRDERAKSALREVDDLRLRYLEQKIQECGIEAEEAKARAVLGYSYMRVAATLIPQEANDLMKACQALIIGKPVRTE